MYLDSCDFKGSHLAIPAAAYTISRTSREVFLSAFPPGPVIWYSACCVSMLNLSSFVFNRSHGITASAKFGP